MPSGAILGAISGSLLGPVFAAAMHRAAGRMDPEGRKVPPRERAILVAVAIGNALVLAGAIVMAGSCMRSVRKLEVLAAALVPVPYAIHRVLQPCIEEYPRF